MENVRIVNRSKISFLIAAPIPVIFILVGYSAISSHHYWPAIILISAFCVAIFPLLFNTVYIIDGTNLKVKSGFIINKDININSITTIIENKGILSAPASSFDRIEIFYNRYDSVVISPTDKKLFAQQLKQINPNIVVTL